MTASAFSSSGSIDSYSQASLEKLNIEIVNKLNKCVIHICEGEFSKARHLFDEVISNSPNADESSGGGGLGLKEITIEKDCHKILPAYVINLLTYFYLRTKNFKMARSMIKSRRFVVDIDHIVQ